MKVCYDPRYLCGDLPEKGLKRDQKSFSDNLIMSKSQKNKTSL